MSFLKNLKRISAAILVSTMVGIFLNTANADILGDIGQEINEIFGIGDAGLSFTQYEGALSQLSKDN
ncbi:hypothetical protein HYW82_02150 [Candidatus Peregrinibacteria bacterium]|nr:hypothetical protein [Candidatus Peregrinibacteria bacterium]